MKSSWGLCELEGYHKQTDAFDYPKVIELLRDHDIDLTALFMVRPDYGLADFRKLNRFITKNRIDIYTISILTPIKGTKSYEDQRSQLVTEDPRKFVCILCLNLDSQELCFIACFTVCI